MHASTAPERLSRWERAGLVALLLAALALGALVEVRSAFLTRRMTDLQVYLRAAWAVSSGHNLYQVTDENEWHYLYPPLLAIALVPLQAPPPEFASDGVVPFAVSVVIWYVLSLVFLCLAVHLLAGALEQVSPDPAVRNQPPGCARWWRLRMYSVVACLPIVGLTLVRGQVGMLALLLFCGMIAAYVRGRRSTAGVWLASSICVKLIPAFLLLLPMVRRDRRALLGCAAGVLLGMVVVPGAVLGPTRAVECYRSWAEVFLLPALGQSDDKSCAKEILEATASHSESPMLVIHNTMYPEFKFRPKEVAAWVKKVHLGIGGVLTVLVLLPALRRRIDSGPALVLLAGSLILVMTQVSPVCHQHYFLWSIPIIMGIHASIWQEGEYTARIGVRLWLLCLVNAAANGLPLIPPYGALLRDLGMPMYCAWFLLGWANVLLWQQPRLGASAAAPVVPAPIARAA